MERDGAPNGRGRNRSVVTTWHGTFLVDGSEVVRALRVPDVPGALAERIRARRDGRLTPEETTLIASRGDELWVARDRRLAGPGVRWDPRARGSEVELGEQPSLGSLRTAILADAERVLTASWDPSVHVQEAVRAASDLHRVRNLIGERLGSWVSRDAPDVDPGDHARVVETALETAPARPLGPSDPSLVEARRRMAELYRAVDATRADLEKAISAAVPGRNPNLSSLLGPELAARLLAQAGGLDRLARLPASTVQVLGAERAFFEHLRGRAPPPRHGLLFLHPAIQSAGRRDRGRLARALAGKVSIAARLDLAGAPLDPALERSFNRRREALRAERSAAPRSTRRSRSRPPLHGASEHR